MDGSGGAQPSSCYEQPKRRRFSEPLKFLPVIFVLCSIFTLWFIYTFYHCVPLMQLGIAEHLVDEETRKRGRKQCLGFHALVIMLLICYVRSILVHPGEVPDRDPQWEYVPRDRAGMDVAPLNLQETKKTGERRHCKWCGKYKPDRCHHCRVCKTCVLKMDHHCPWLYNCVGHFNYKYFFLLLLYSLLACHLMLWTMPESINNAMNQEVQEFHTLFMVCFGQALSLFLGTLVTLFFGFHIWLMMKAMTTIEFCEKSMPKKDSEKTAVYESSAYDIGIYGNIRTALGENPLFWLIPCDVPAGDGLSFVSDEKRLTVDMEAAHGMRRKTHQKTQRPTRATRSASAGPAVYGEAGQNQGRAYDYSRQ